MPTIHQLQVLAAPETALAPRPQLAARARFALAAWCGRALYRLKLGRVSSLQREGEAFYLKARHRHSAALISAGNAIQKLRRGELLGLHQREWLAWEEQCGALAWPREVGARSQVLGGALLCPALPGEPLRAILRSKQSLESRLRAVELAARELQRLQSLEMRFPDGGLRAWSHGDAHAGNVLVDVEAGSASWFDFETVHAAWCPPAWRHADDLRALAYSCAACCCAGDSEPLAQALAHAIECPRLRVELLAQSRCLQRRARAFHLAQAPMRWAGHQGFGRALQAALVEAAPPAEPGDALRCALQVLECDQKRLQAVGCVEDAP